ncbi:MULTISPECIES: AAA family ATPase [unclassified Microcoleus]|uniref:AAA family ATPase n=1 Tax=unclassified Microcoleus TaxID=2642155 RepID=UPI002FCE8B8E
MTPSILVPDEEVWLSSEGLDNFGNRKLTSSSKTNPCPHCGKPDWCYSIGNLSVCNRDQPPATGWEATSKTDQDGHLYYAPIQEKKAIRPAQTTYFYYPARDGSPLVRVKRIDFGDGRKKEFIQQHWDATANEWVTGLGKVKRSDIPVYHYAKVQEAKAQGVMVFIVDGENCVKKLEEIGVVATTSIGGMGKWKDTDTSDLRGAKVAISPDRDIPGIEDATKVSEHFPEAQWLYPYSKSKAWANLPKSQGLDVRDWIESQNLSAADVLAAVGEKKNFTAPKTALCEPVKTQKLPLKEAAALAKAILNRQGDELSANIELEAVRERTGMSDYSWEHKIIKPLRRDMDAERFKMELLSLLQMEDAVERCRQIALLAPKYSMGAGTIKEAMAAMKSRTQTPEVKVLTFDDLLASESEALEWRVQELLPVGETVLFVALPKVGKSKAAVDLAFCVATGENHFLGREVKQGRVLMITPDASQQSLKHELLKRGFRSGDSKNIRIMPRWNIDQMAILEQQLEDFRPDLVIIDSLKKITAGKEISENSAEFADNIIALNDMLSRYRASGILIHHASKSNEAVGVAKARGSTAIVGACWGVWDLERIPKPDPNNKKKMIADPKCPKRIFTATSRDSEGLSLNIEFNPENNSFDFISEVGIEEAEAQQQQTYRERILAVLRKNPQPLSGPELMELMGAGKEQRGSIYSELGRMESKRLIICKPAPRDKRYNLYSLPDFTQTGTLGTVPPRTEISLPPPPPIPTVPIADYVSENYTQYGLDNSQQDSQQVVSNFSECDSVEKAVTVDIARIDPIVSNSPLSQGGGGVKCDSLPQAATASNPQLAHAELNLTIQKSSQPSSTTIVVDDRVEVRLRGDAAIGKQGIVRDIVLGATDTTYYVQLEGELLIMPVPRSQGTFAYLRKL